MDCSPLSTAVPPEEIIYSCFFVQEKLPRELSLTHFRLSSKYLLHQLFKPHGTMFNPSRWESIHMNNSAGCSECSHLWEKDGEDRWEWCCCSLIQYNWDWSAFLTSVCVCVRFKGLFGSPMFLIWLWMLWVLEVGVLTNCLLAGDETWTLAHILDRGETESRNCVHITLQKM